MLPTKKRLVFEPSKAWNFTFNTLSKWFDITENNYSNFELFETQIKNNPILKKHLAPFYKFSSTNGLPNGDFSKLQYIPVGIIKHKK